MPGGRLQDLADYLDISPNQRQSFPPGREPQAVWDWLASLQQVLTRQTCADERAFFRLHGAGLVRHEGRAVVPRIPLYAAYFGERLRG